MSFWLWVNVYYTSFLTQLCQNRPFCPTLERENLFMIALGRMEWIFEWQTSSLRAISHMHGAHKLLFKSFFCQKISHENFRRRVGKWKTVLKRSQPFENNMNTRTFSLLKRLPTEREKKAKSLSVTKIKICNHKKRISKGTNKTWLAKSFCLNKH